MTSQPELRGRPAVHWHFRRKAAAVAATGAVLVSGLGILPPAVAQAGPGGMLPAALNVAPEGVGPVNPNNGYPYWYGDTGIPEAGLDPVRLELCLDAVGCPVIGVDYDNTQPLAIPGNFPEESFWWSAEAEMDLPGGGQALLVLAQEAAFGGAGEVAAGQQNGFARLRIRIDDGVPGQSYTFTHPYGTETLVADDRGRVRHTEDIGCLQQPCTWDEPLDGSIGPFLRWDPAVAPAAPEGFIGDPNVQHQVVGSPNGTNFFRVEGVFTAGGAMATAQTDLFAVQGKIATLEAGVDKRGGLYNAAQDVKIQASFPEEAKIVYTTDGTDPQVGEAGAVVNGLEYVPDAGNKDAAAVVTLDTPGTTTLKYLAVVPATGETTEIYSETYELDATKPWIEATPAAEGPMAGPQTVTLTGTTQTGEAPSIFYTLDGSAPRFTADGQPEGSTRLYSDPFTIASTATLRAVSVDGTGAAGEIRSFRYVIHNLKAVGPVGDHGFPQWLEDNGWEGQDPVRLELCLDDPLCPIVDVLPDPAQPASFPDNFPGEAFWWAADAEMTIGAEDIRLTLASEAAWAAEEVRDGDQVAFGRIRVRGDGVFVPGATYRITHPYGVLEVAADEVGDINFTEDLGSMNGNGDFTPLLEAKIGPFLRWTEGAPAGYLGDGTTPHAVVGSPFNTNVFRIEQLTDGTGAELDSPAIVGETEEFIVQGRTAGAEAPAPATAAASVAGGTFAAPQAIELAADPAGAQIFFTTDGTDPDTDSTLYTGPIDITAEGATTLKFIAFNGVASDIVTETYTLDFTAPAVTADPAGGTLAAGSLVTLTASENAAIYYTLDGSQPTDQSLSYSGPMEVTGASTLRAIAIDQAGNVSDIGAWTFEAADGSGEENPGDPGDPGTENPAEPGGETPGGSSGRISDNRDFNGDNAVDVIARDSQGVLWLYPGNGEGRLLPKIKMGASGWNTMTSIFSPGDFDGDGDADVLARDRAGKLWLYPGTGEGRLLKRIQAGTGWNTMTSIFSPGDFNGDRDTDVLSRHKNGTLWLYPGNGNGGWLKKVQVGTGWNGMTAIFSAGDFDGDDNADVLARHKNGTLWLYPGNGKGRWLPWKQIGTGWNSMTSIFSAGDFDGDDNADVLARNKNGSLWLYRGNGEGRWLTWNVIGSRGWNNMSAF
ncbi:chitobiase/beta-hexosaminidase C-terminal domain-containing protein [Arthrobacter sp. Marseille-P9274]|uniref:chitobiase/beta-hexosaminidase C-terminal domain-containing protein n=1 Tax=Arthrobacter sp. Marseille-P9274 TaxID=2866572 RepID=UPI0021C8A379|nr:chitobiase/beta-hexosaminidase C-terminal domain-containing protein [Arthrobacter sp. Marseille-P9274]